MFVAYADFQGCYTAVTTLLNSTSPDAFVPTIDELDLLIPVHKDRPRKAPDPYNPFEHTIRSDSNNSPHARGVFLSLKLPCQEKGI
jgi:hypothetical protein